VKWLCDLGQVQSMDCFVPDFGAGGVLSDTQHGVFGSYVS
jgi:hypothetical protein